MDNIRLNKYLASCGVASRREADKLIEAGKVTVDGKRAKTGDTVTGAEKIIVDGMLLKGPERKLVVAFYKPVGVTVTESDPHAQETVFDYIDLPERLTYAGRLDKDSEGLLLLTNDGELIHELMQGAHAHEKEYIVYLDKEPDMQMIEKLSKGVYLPELEKKTRPCRIEKLRRQVVRMVLTEGLNREIRRIWNTENIKVKALKRVRVGSVTLGDLKPGEYSILSEKEVSELKAGLAKERAKRKDHAPAKVIKKTGEGYKAFNTGRPVFKGPSAGIKDRFDKKGKKDGN